MLSQNKSVQHESAGNLGSMGINRVLVVEDDPLNMKLFRKILTLDGYEVLEAMEATTGIEIARKKEPDIIVMDIQLPGISGLEAVTVLKAWEETKDIPIIAVTGYATEEDKSLCINAGCADFLTKPLDTRHFTAVIRQYLTS